MSQSDYSRVAQAIHYLCEQVPDQPTLAQVAAQAGLSEFHFQRVFQKWAGISPKRFLQYQTVEEAKALLRADRPVLETAWEVGMSGGGRLHDLFVQVEAMTPGEYAARGAGLVIRQATHRTPYGDCLVAVTDRGLIPADRQMRTNVGHIYAIGDIIGQPMLAHKAVHEAHVAAEAAAGRNSYFDARQIPSVAYTDPEVAWAGLTEQQCKAQGVKYAKAVFPWAASGRAIANGRDEGFTKLLFDETTHRCIGGGIVGTHAGDLISEVCLAVEMGCDAADIGQTIHPHPTLGESIGMTAEIFEGICPDMPPARRKGH